MHELQSVIFQNEYYNAKTAMIYLKKHKLKPIKRVHKTKNTLRYRIKDPIQYKKFSSRKNKIDKITFVFGLKK